MRIDFVALGVLGGLIIFSAILYIVFRAQSKKSEHPLAEESNASNPTLLQHAPADSQRLYSASMLSLGSSLGKPRTPELKGEEASLAEEGKKFKRRLFFEDTAEDELVGRRGSQAV